MFFVYYYKIKITKIVNKKIHTYINYAQKNLYLKTLRNTCLESKITKYLQYKNNIT